MAWSAQTSPGAAGGFASADLRTGFLRRLAEFGALLLLLLGLALLAALVTYDPADPSLNTATARAAQNLLKLPGAIAADLLLQGFGIAAALPGFALLAWAWRIGSHRGLGSLPLRLAFLLAALPVLAGVLAAVPGPSGLPLAWPAAAGPGGAAGQFVGSAVLNAGRELFGPFGGLALWCLGALLACVLTLLALGLTATEWRAAGVAAKAGAVHGRSAASLSARLGRRFARFGAALLQRINGTPAAEEAAAPPDTGTRPTGTSPPIRHEPILIDPPPPRPLPPTPPNPPPRDDKNGPRKPPTAQTWNFPSLDLLTTPPSRAAIGAPSKDALDATARMLETVLHDYGVEGEIVAYLAGPVVTLFELVPAPGVRSARVIGLADDVARTLAVTAVRIATVPGRNVIGIEVPNRTRETVYFTELLQAPEWVDTPFRLPLALGKDIAGKAIIADMARMPHLLVAGTTGSGKSVGINAMILSLLYKLSPDQCRLILIDPKMLELSVYEGIPHLLAPVVTEPAKAVVALKWTVREMERRYRAMSQLGVRNIAGYNDRVAQARGRGEIVTRKVQTGFDSETGKPVFEEQPLALEPLPLIVVFIDEMADLMMVAGKEIETTVQRLAQMARAAGIHVIMATQRPSVDVITGTIKANFPTRISFTVISKFDSRTILGEQGAEQLLGQGDMLYMAQGGRIMRVHGPFVSDDEVEKVVAHLREQGEPDYVEDVTEAPEGSEDEGNASPAGDGGDLTLFDQAVDVVAREGKASTSFLQRHLNIGYNRAAKLIEQMEKQGIVGPANHVGKRDVIARHTARDDED
ncbi:MAG: DNA translocase FtsK 4TM domain-containing protein [Alphaproteobacteria bacterium]|nr:DNA translocase FtsK 4TM domain-containing protein [Alphaproteobacteria bacterium]